ncbi:MAG TPA: lysophospholipid acyltransferase family protein [Candidatus Binatia bacterium]|jgi:lysophospholipid acyltransferase (LPLAT)-like uncharacterized protein|nr:lysophospholipid acyltransferase family protein [Candidatus Binatia bacterium]
MDAPELQSSIRKRRSLGVRLLRWIVPRIFFAYSYLLFRSCRITYVAKHHENHFLDQGLPVLFAGFHEGMLYLPYHFRDRDGVVMVSASRDGDLIADTMALFGLRAARGSSTRGGRAALDAMADEINATRCSGGIIVDGPRGPALIAKMGAITLGAATGLPVVPGAWWARRALRLKSWDGTIIPLPFTRMVFAFEPALEVPPDASPAVREAMRDELTARLARARATAQAATSQRAGITNMAPQSTQNAD